MGKRRDSHKDERIKRLILEKTPTKVICEREKVSAATVSRRRQELSILAIQIQKQYDRHQEQLIETAQALRRCIELPEPAFIYIEDLHARRTWHIERHIEWEIRSGDQVFLSIPTEIQNWKRRFFGREVEIMPVFRAHTQTTGLWRQLNQWGELGGQYIKQCWRRLIQIQQQVASEKPLDIPIIRETSEVRDGVQIDLTPQVCILPMFHQAIYSYPLRGNWAGSKVEYRTTSVFENGICHVSLYCDKDESSPNPIFRAPCDQKEPLIRLHQRLLKNHELVGSLKDKFQETTQIGEEIRSELSRYVTQEFVVGTCLLCADWVKMQRLRAD